MHLNIKKLDPSAKLPSYAHPEDAGFDLYAIRPLTIAPGERIQVPTGIAMEIPDGYVGLIWDKSGLSHKHGLKTLGGVVDAGYRGEIMIGMINLSSAPYTFEAGHKVAQMLIQKREAAIIKEVSELSDAARGTGGFGSSGK